MKVRTALIVGAIGVVGIGSALDGGDQDSTKSSKIAATATPDGGSTSSLSVSPETASSGTPPPAHEEIPEKPPVNITVDALLDKLNNTSDVKLGDRFKVTGELFESEIWGVGASGDYSVYLKAKGGANDLEVFVDRSEARAWHDGMRVQMILKSVAVTINGETTDTGWLRAESTTVL